MWNYCDRHLFLGLIFCVERKFRLRHAGDIRLPTAPRRLLACGGWLNHLRR